MYVEFYSNTDILQSAIQSVSEIQVDIQDLAVSPDVPLRVICTANSEQLDTFQAELASDPTVEDAICLDASGGRRLYRIIATPDTTSQKAYETAIELDGIYLNSRSTTDGWYNKMNFPGRESFRQFQTRVGEFGMDVEPTVMKDGKFLLSNEGFGLTPKQKEILAEAIKTGYFEIPRAASLSDVADRVDVSQQAASERLRRGMRTVAEKSVADHFNDTI